jgi:putative membrane protein
MTMRWLFAYLHLLALPIGAAAIVTRALAFRSIPHGGSFRRVFLADIWWAVAGVLWVTTGLTRYLSGLEKGTDYYNGNAFFLAKMALLVLVFVLEVPSGITLVRWRLALKKGQEIDTAKAIGLARLNYLQAALAVLMVACATAMARGLDL